MKNSELRFNERGSERLDHDDFGQLLADGEAGFANLTDEIGLASEELNDVVFAKAKFAKPGLDFGGGAELLNPNGDTGFDSA
jgi:hypothetical protein